MKRINFIWLLILLVAFGYLIYQKSFTHIYDTDAIEERIELKEDEVLFVTAKQQNFSFRKRGFESLISNLSFWNIDEEKKKIYLRGEALLPSDDTPLFFIYNKGSNSYQSQENIIPVTNFPYHVEEENVSIEFSHINNLGETFLEVQGKMIMIKPGETYKGVWFDGYFPKLIEIKNYGIFKRTNFEILQ